MTLVHKGILVHGKEGIFLHHVVLVSSRDECPGQPGQTYCVCLCTDFQDVNKRTLVEGYPAPDL